MSVGCSEKLLLVALPLRNQTDEKAQCTQPSFFVLAKCFLKFNNVVLSPFSDDPRLHYSASKCVGGKLPFKGSEALGLRVLIDGSCVEAYTNSGAALSARVYR